MFNKMIAVGRITDSPVLRRTNTGKAVANFTIALNRIPSYGKGKHADFFDVIVWNTPGENCAKYLKKGSLVLVEGRMQSRSYEDKSGIVRRKTELVADEVQFLDPKGSYSKKEETIEDEELFSPFEEEICDELPFEE